MRSDFWSLPYAAQQAIQKGGRDAASARCRAFTIDELRKENAGLREAMEGAAKALEAEPPIGDMGVKKWCHGIRGILLSALAKAG